MRNNVLFVLEILEKFSCGCFICYQHVQNLFLFRLCHTKIKKIYHVTMKSANKPEEKNTIYFIFKQEWKIINSMA